MNGTDTQPGHWWRTLLAGVVAVAVGAGDLIHFGRDAGLSVEMDELLIIGGIGLIAGVPRVLWSMRGGQVTATEPRAVETASTAEAPVEASTPGRAQSAQPE